MNIFLRKNNRNYFAISPLSPLCMGIPAALAADLLGPANIIGTYEVVSPRQFANRDPILSRLILGPSSFGPTHILASCLAHSGPLFRFRNVESQQAFTSPGFGSVLSSLNIKKRKTSGSAALNYVKRKLLTFRTKDEEEEGPLCPVSCGM